ncbi:MAG: membrane protein [Saprospiraceae bacterium]|nr:MAG: membrane protein [Saprospiraceae bacterium]
MFFNSCTEDLELAPTSIISVNSFWSTEDDAKGGLYGMYTRMRSQCYDNLFSWGGARAELLSYGLQASEGLERYFENTLDPISAGPDWKGLYTVIHDANLLLKNVPDIDFRDEKVKNETLAQAHAMRAYVYFIIARTWGGAPIVTAPSEGYDAEVIFKPRASISEVYTLIKQDIDMAISLFPDDSFSPGRSIWSRPAVNALKGDVYLWTAKTQGGGNADLQTALTALQAVKTGDVALLPAYDDVFRYSNKGNSEVLMAMHLEDLEASNMYSDLMYIRNDQIPANATQESKDLLGTGGGLNRWAPAEGFRDQFADDDSRKDATFVAMFTDDGTGPAYYASATLKYRGFVDAGSRKFLDDIILYRYADVLLMIAEAKNGLGQDPTAEMNAVRERAYGANFAGHEFVSGSQADNDDAILQERLFELSFEAKRWWDLVRFDKAFELVPSLNGRENDRYLLLFPIPITTLSLNSSLVQNPGYN